MGKVIQFVIVGIIALGIIGSCAGDSARQKQAAKDAADAQASAQRVKAAREAKATKCRAEIEALTISYEQHFKERRFKEAGDTLRDCAQATGEPAIQRAVASAHAAELIEAGANAKSSVRERVMALDRLHAEYPEAFKGQETLYSSLQKRIAAEEAAEKRRVAAEKRKQGVSIGMTQEDVLASQWGKPRKINRSTYSWGTKEQWVYDGGYLYFTNGVLDAIQN
jgi:hypothetical protein